MGLKPMSVRMSSTQLDLGYPMQDRRVEDREVCERLDKIETC